MTTVEGPNIIKSGLVLYLDAANSKSYSGSGSTWTDLINNANNGTLVNSPTYSSSNKGYFAFNGSTNYIEVASSSDITFASTTSYSLSAWVYLPSVPSVWTGMVTKSRDVQPWYGLWISGGSKLWTWATPNTGGAILNLQGTSATTGWHNLCGVYDVTNNLSTLYVDGEYNVSGALGTPSAVGSGNLIIGAAKTTSAIEFFYGNISNVAIYNKALSATEVLQNFDSLRGRYGI